MPVVVAVSTVVLIVFLLWFAFGTQHNISRGNALLRWLQGGLPRVAGRTTLRWLGSSAVLLDLSDVRAPYTAAQVSVVLEPRDLGWLWAWARRRGRRDFLILRGTLIGPPRFELEAGGRGWTGADRLDRLDPTAWSRTTWEDDTGIVAVAHSPGAEVGEVDELRALWQRLDDAAGSVWRLSVRNQAPHVEVHVEPPPSDGADASDLLGTFGDLGRFVTRTD